MFSCHLFFFFFLHVRIMSCFRFIFLFVFSTHLLFVHFLLSVLILFIILAIRREKRENAKRMENKRKNVVLFHVATLNLLQLHWNLEGNIFFLSSLQQLRHWCLPVYAPQTSTNSTSSTTIIAVYACLFTSLNYSF